MFSPSKPELNIADRKGSEEEEEHVEEEIVLGNYRQCTICARRVTRTSAARSYCVLIKRLLAQCGRVQTIE